MDRSEFLKASPPMFKSGVLDKFTRVHHLVPVVIFLPAIAILFAFGRRGPSAGKAPARQTAASSPCGPPGTASGTGQLASD